MLELEKRALRMNVKKNEICISRKDVLVDMERLKKYFISTVSKARHSGLLSLADREFKFLNAQLRTFPPEKVKKVVRMALNTVKTNLSEKGCDEESIVLLQGIIERKWIKIIRDFDQISVEEMYQQALCEWDILAKRLKEASDAEEKKSLASDRVQLGVSRIATSGIFIISDSISIFTSCMSDFSVNNLMFASIYTGAVLFYQGASDILG
jgi:hypothetical protein